MAIGGSTVVKAGGVLEPEAPLADQGGAGKGTGRVFGLSLEQHCPAWEPLLALEGGGSQL